VPTWDVTATDTVAALYLNNTASRAGSAAEAVATRKEENIQKLLFNIISLLLLLKRLDQ